MWTVEARGLSKTFGRFVSLDDCHLQVPEGCIFGLLGPNGAGKSTLIRTLLGFLRPSDGEAKVCGFDIVRQSLDVRRQVAYLPGDARLYRTLRGSDTLRMFADFHPCGNRERSLHVARRLDLDLTRRVAFMSTGMRQKLALSIVFGCTAPLVILDEPTANLDPNVTREVLLLAKEARRSGQTVMFSSHIFSDIDETCDQVAILRAGRIVACQDMAELEQYHIVRGSVPESAWSSLAAILPNVAPEGAHSGEPQAAPETLESWSRDRAHEQQPTAADLVRIELRFRGPANDWMPWLVHLQSPPIGLCDVTLQQAGIRSLYEAHHAAVVPGLDSDSQVSGRADSSGAEPESVKS